MPVISEKYVIEIKIITSQLKGVMAQDEKIRFRAKSYVWLVVVVRLKKENKKEFTVVEDLILPCFKPIYSFFSLCNIILFFLVIFSLLFCVLSYYIEIILICQD